MTVNQLIKQLEKIRAKHGKRIQVCVNVKGVKNAQADERYTHVTVNDLQVERINWFVDDNCYLQDGSERTRTVVTLCSE